MSLKTYLILMSVAAALCWLAWGFVVWSFNPFESGITALLFFYGSLYMAIVGTYSVIGFMVTRIVSGDDSIVFRHVRKTFRQSFFVATGCVAVLILCSHGWFAWWNALILIMLIVGLEAVVFTNRKYRNAPYVQ